MTYKPNTIYNLPYCLTRICADNPYHSALPHAVRVDLPRQLLLSAKRDVNKTKRLDWAKLNVEEQFDDVIWSDECTVQAESHRRFCCRKKGERPKNKPRCVLKGSFSSPPFYTLALCHTLTLYHMPSLSSISLP